ncbi:aconitate hydratase AcnA, partial [Achromobacter xylosoxidans]
AAAGPQTRGLAPGDRIEIDCPAHELAPRQSITVRLLRANGATQSLRATAAVETQLELRLLRMGGVIPAILADTLGDRARTPERRAEPPPISVHP